MEFKHVMQDDSSFEHINFEIRMLVQVLIESNSVFEFSEQLECFTQININFDLNTKIEMIE